MLPKVSVCATIEQEWSEKLNSRIPRDRASSSVWRVFTRTAENHRKTARGTRPPVAAIKIDCEHTTNTIVAETSRLDCSANYSFTDNQSRH